VSRLAALLHEGSGCSCSGNSDCVSNDCEKGWLCRYNAPDPVTGFFGNPGSHRCIPLYGACPPDYSCAAASSTTAACTYEPPMLTIDAGGPYAGEPDSRPRFTRPRARRRRRSRAPRGSSATAGWPPAPTSPVYTEPFGSEVTVLVLDELQDAGEASAQIFVSQ
jgi:hypothetical protein